MSYALKNWVALTRYCGDGDLSIVNNHAEKSLRSIARAGATTGRS